MNRLLVSLSTIFILFVIVLSPAFAKITPTPSATPSPTLTPTPTPTVVDSYIRFWPLVAGKTASDPLYFLKILKEKVSEIFLLDSAKNTEYQITLATKRILEVEKLTKDKKENTAVSSAKNAKSHLEKALSKANSTKDFSSIKTEAQKKLTNIQDFLPNLKEKTSDSVDSILDELAKKVSELQSKLQ